MSCTFDAGAQACYLRVSVGDVVETVQINDSVYVDLDDRGRPLGIEILGVSSTEVIADIPGVKEALARHTFAEESRRFVLEQSVSATAPGH